MRTSRRTFLKFTTGVGLLAASGELLSSCSNMMSSNSNVTAEIPWVSGMGNKLRFPAAFQGNTIVAAQTTQNIYPEFTSKVWTFGNSYPAPSFDVRKGDSVNVTLKNALADPTIIHWHGLLVSQGMDGQPMDAIQTGGQYSYSFKVQQRAGTYWYHPHPHRDTARQAYMGMAGFFMIRDNEEDALSLPSGEFELPLCIQDRRLQNSKELSYTPSMMDIMAGYLGDTILVNGTPQAYLGVKSKLYRMRLLNGSNARVYFLGFDNNMPFHIIGTDCGLLDRPYEVRSAYLAAGERLDILVDFSRVISGQSTFLESRSFSSPNSMGQMHSGSLEQGTKMPILRFDISGSGNLMQIPTTLASFEKLYSKQAKRTRIFSLQGSSSMMSGMHTINAKLYDMNRIDEQIPFGDLEIWEFRNGGAEFHPMHIHGAHFQVLDRNGNTSLAPTDLGWKDTVLVNANETVRILIRFDSFKGNYLLHCHNLEHEDDGMMQNIEII